MPKYVLYYFNVEVRAEAIRLMFKLAGVDFEDRRIPRAEWPQYRHKFPMKQVPVLEVDGVLIAQSKAILRYLAREFGFYGSTTLEGAFIDEVMDTAYDAFGFVRGMIQADGPEEEEFFFKTFKEKLLGVYTRLDALLALERAGDFFIGNSITAADIFFFGMADSMDVHLQCNTLENFPKLNALKSRVAANPVIGKWLVERPRPERVLDFNSIRFAKAHGLTLKI